MLASPPVTEAAGDQGVPRSVRALLTRHLTPVLVAALIQACASAALGSRAVLIPLRSVELGLSRGEVGLVFAVWTVSAAVFSLPGALLIERLGLRRALVAAFACYLVAQALPGLVDHPAALVISMMFGGAAGVLAQVTLMTWITAAQPPGGVARSLGWFTLAMQLGNTLGPAIAGFLLTWISTKAAFLATTAMLAPALGLVFFAPRRSGAPRRAGPSLRLFALLQNPVAALIAFVFLFASAGYGSYQSYFALWARFGIGLNAATVGLLIGISAVSSAISRVPAGRLLGRLTGHENRALMAAATAAGGVLMLLPHATGMTWAAAAAIAFMPLYALAQLAAAVSLTSAAEPAAKASALSVYTLVYNLGWGGGAVAFAPFMQVGYVEGFTVTGAVCGAVGLAGMLAVARRVRREAGR